MERKDRTIDIVKGIAIILVVYGHVIQHSTVANGGDFFSNPVFKVIYTFHMPLFVFISGYLIAFSLSRKGAFDVFKARCKSLFVPFVSWTVLGIMAGYFFNIMDGKHIGVDPLRDLKDQLLLYPLIWFLFTLFILSCMLLFSIKLEKRTGPAAFLAVYAAVLLIPYNSYCSLYYIKWFYLFYLAGFLINTYGIKITSGPVNKAVALVSSIAFVVLVSHWTKDDYIYINKMGFASNRYFYEILRIIYRYAAGFLGILMAFYAGAYLLKTRTENLWEYVGRYALDVYLIQIFIVEGLYPRLVYNARMDLDINSPLFLCFFAPLVTALSVCACLLISKLLIRQNRALNTLLLGGRA